MPFPPKTRHPHKHTLSGDIVQCLFAHHSPCVFEVYVFSTHVRSNTHKEDAHRATVMQGAGTLSLTHAQTRHANTSPIVQHPNNSNTHKKDAQLQPLRTRTTTHNTQIISMTSALWATTSPPPSYAHSLCMHSWISTDTPVTHTHKHACTEHWGTSSPSYTCTHAHTHSGASVHSLRTTALCVATHIFGVCCVTRPHIHTHVHAHTCARAQNTHMHTLSFSVQVPRHNGRPIL